MNYRETVEYMEEMQRRRGSVMGLDAMRELCAALGNPQDRLRFVHIAGTNGKGSVLAFVSTVLQCAGYRVGRYLSPAIREYRERFQVNGRMISQAALCRIIGQVKEAADGMVSRGLDAPTAFEMETAAAFLFFLEKKCDPVVLETGLGGAEDATNIVQNTLAAVFTSISMDHMQILGDSLDKIASVKSGIIKNGCYVISSAQQPEVERILRRAAGAHQAPFVTADAAKARKIKYGVDGQRFSYGVHKDIRISLAGRYQIENAVTALETLEALGGLGYPAGGEALRQGMAQARWPGRFEVLGRNPLLIADGAHNEDAAKRLAESVRFYFAGRRILYIMGMLRDKEYERVIACTCDLAEHIITVTPPVKERALSAYELAQAVRRCHAGVTVADSVQEALELAYLLAGQDRNCVIVAFGSLSYLGELMDAAEHRDAIRRDTHGRSEQN